MAILQPYHQRLLRHRRAGEYNTAINGSAVVARWYPLKMLLAQRFRGSEGKVAFTDLEIGALLRLRDEYESGVGRKG